MTAFPHLDVDPNTIELCVRPRGCRRGYLGEGDAGVVYEAQIPSVCNGKPVAIKVFKPFAIGRHSYITSRTTGRGLTPYDRESMAYSVILNDKLSKDALPVVRAYGWFELPIGFRLDREILREARRVIVKEKVEGPHLNFDLVSPEEMLNDRRTLSRLQLFDTDIKVPNYIAGKLVDLSAFYYIPDLSRSDHLHVQYQVLRLMLDILRYEGQSLSFTASEDTIECVWREWLSHKKKHDKGGILPGNTESLQPVPSIFAFSMDGLHQWRVFVLNHKAQVAILSLGLALFIKRTLMFRNRFSWWKR